MPRKDSPYFVKHDMSATPFETKPSFTAAKHAWRFLHPKRHVEFLCWCLLQMDSRYVVEVLRTVARAYRLSPPCSLFRNNFTDEEVVQNTLDMVKGLENQSENP